MQKSKNNAYNPKEKGPLLARSISQTGAFNYTRFFFPLTANQNRIRIPILLLLKSVFRKRELERRIVKSSCLREGLGNRSPLLRDSIFCLRLFCQELFRYTKRKNR